MYLLLILSSILLIFSFHNFNFSYLVFIGFVPLFFALENQSPKKTFLISLSTGFIFYLGDLHWLYHVTIIGLIILCLYLALYFGIFGFLFSLTAIRYTLYATPLIWIFLEYIQAHLSIIGFGWALLGYSQYKNLLLIQIADFSGVYGVSFLIMMINVAIYRVLKKSFLEAAIAGLILIVVIGYGIIKEDKEVCRSDIKVSVIQGNISQKLKWDPKAQDMIIEKYIALTKMASLDNPGLIIWPETSFPGFFEIDEKITDKVLNLAKDIKVPILVGINTEKDGKYFNSAGLISIQGKMVDKYDKIHLVPFGEYVPFSDKFPALHNLVLGELGEFTPGKEFKIFDIQDNRQQTTGCRPKFGVLICFEDIFAEISRRFVKDGANFLIVITNDAWYGKSGAAYQHAACSVFRAIENRVPVIRCANTGYSCFIDSRGRIYYSVEEKDSNLFVTGYKTSAVNIK